MKLDMPDGVMMKRDWQNVRDERSTFMVEMISKDKLRLRSRLGHYVSSNERGELISGSYQNIVDENFRVFFIKKERIGEKAFNIKLVNSKNSSLQLSTQFTTPKSSRGVNYAQKKSNQLVIEANGRQIRF